MAEVGLFEEEMLTSGHYYWGACYVCGRKSCPDNVMKRCSRCRCVYYCSQEHQKQNWKEHKELCKYLATAAVNADQFNFFSGFKSNSNVEWNKFRMNAVQTCEVLLSRHLSIAEREIFLFPRACRVCNSSEEQMFDCAGCYCVSYCSLQHQQEDAPGHAANCSTLRLTMIADTYESKVGVGFPAIPSHVDAKYLGSAPDITHFIPEPMSSNGKEIRKEDLDHCFLTNHLSGALTILHSIHTFSPALAEKSALTIHAVGATIYEVIGLIKWEYLLHRLPSVQTINFHFIGPQQEQEDDEQSQPAVPTCPDCENKQRTVTYSSHRMRYCDFRKLDTFTEPDIVLAQNCGFSEFDDAQPTAGWTEGWSSDLPNLAPRAEHSLLVFTSYTHCEAEADLARLRKYCDVAVLVSDENPMRSHRPCRDWERDMNKDVFFSNQYLTVVKRNVS